MNDLPEHTSDLFKAMRGKSETTKSLAKKTKLDEEQVEETLRQWQSERSWVESEPKGKDQVWRLTDVGENTLTTQYGA
ncbi:MAG: hypothetical protein H0W42_12310 [Gemmatimonadaceae bacterium]|nr:hypothetical protein [Gemmatimonadaceae bacterium]